MTEQTRSPFGGRYITQRYWVLLCVWETEKAKVRRVTSEGPFWAKWLGDSSEGGNI